MAASTVLRDHCSDDPTGEQARLIRADRAALALCKSPWVQMVGMPSLLIDEAAERASPRQALIKALGLESIEGYRGTRIANRGGCLAIEGARLWILRNGSSQTSCQTARFNS